MSVAEYSIRTVTSLQETVLVEGVRACLRCRGSVLNSYHITIGELVGGFDVIDDPCSVDCDRGDRMGWINKGRRVTLRPVCG